MPALSRSVYQGKVGVFLSFCISNSMRISAYSLIARKQCHLLSIAVLWLVMWPPPASRRLRCPLGRDKSVSFETPVPLTLWAFISVCWMNKPMDTLVESVWRVCPFFCGGGKRALKVCTVNKCFKGSHFVLTLAAVILKLDQKASMAPAQGWHANSWSVPYFVKCPGGYPHTLRLAWKKYEPKHNVWHSVAKSWLFTIKILV